MVKLAHHLHQRSFTNSNFYECISLRAKVGIIIQFIRNFHFCSRGARNGRNDFNGPLEPEKLFVSRWKIPMAFFIILPQLPSETKGRRRRKSNNSRKPEAKFSVALELFEGFRWKSKKFFELWNTRVSRFIKLLKNFLYILIWSLRDSNHDKLFSSFFNQNSRV